MGYKYSGPDSFYRLTMPEIRRLQRGYEKLHENDGGGKGKKKKGRRKSDNKKLALFKKKKGLI